MATNLLLQGWDVANAAELSVINAAMLAQDKTPASFAQTPQSGSAGPTLKGNWDAWSMVAGGSDQMLRMECPIKTGTATFAGVAQLDPAKSNTTQISISAGGLTASVTAAGVVASAFCNAPQTTGKYYFEATTNPEPTAGVVMVGIVPADSMVAGIQRNFARDPNAFGYISNGKTENNVTLEGFLPTGGAGVGGVAGEKSRAGDIVGVAVDLDNGKIWFRGPSGAWQGVGADPASGTGAAYAIAANTGMVPAVQVNANSSVTLNFGASAFKFAPPNGFANGWSGSTVVKLDGAAAEIEIELAQVSGGAKKTSFMVDAAGAAGNSPVTTRQIKPASGATIPVAQLRSIQLAFDDWFNANIAQFDNVFHVVDLDPGLATGNLAWLKPSQVDYAYADAPSGNPPTGNPTKGVFAILSMTHDPAVNGVAQPRKPSMTTSATIDPAIIADMPAGANSVYAISAERFVSQMLSRTAKAMMDGSTENDFDYDQASLTITNNKDLNWRALKLEDGYTVTPQVKTGNLKVSVDGNKIRVEMIDVTFTHPLAQLHGSEVITIHTVQRLYLALKKRTDGKHVLVVQNYDPDSKTPPADPGVPDFETFDISYNIDQDAKSYQNAMLITTIALSVLTIGLVAFSGAAWIIRSRTLANVAEGAAANGDDDAALDRELEPARDQYGKIPVGGADYENVDDVLDAAGKELANAVVEPNPPAPGVLPPPAVVVSAPGAMLGITKLAIAGSIVSVLSAGGLAAAGTFYGLTQGELEKLNSGDVDKLKADLTFESQLKDILSAFEWTGTNSWTLVDVRLRESLLVYGKLT